METLPSFWPSTEDQLVMACFFEEYPMLAYGMCYLFGFHRQAGMSRDEAALHVRSIVDAQVDDDLYRAQGDSDDQG